MLQNKLLSGDYNNLIYIYTEKMRTIADIIFGIIGFMYLIIRYRKRYTDIVQDEYMGSYSMAGRKIVLQLMLLCLLIGAGVLLLTSIGRYAIDGIRRLI